LPLSSLIFLPVASCSAGRRCSCHSPSRHRLPLLPPLAARPLRQVHPPARARLPLGRRPQVHQPPRLPADGPLHGRRGIRGIQGRRGLLREVSWGF
uniref:Uncharacterized protein n=1 Tax=Oryza glaberrima TaxID=4538 RepID=I1R0U0_ORYGL